MVGKVTPQSWTPEKWARELSSIMLAKLLYDEAEGPTL